MQTLAIARERSSAASSTAGKEISDLRCIQFGLVIAHQQGQERRGSFWGKAVADFNQHGPEEHGKKTPGAKQPWRRPFK
jgi:hypothetical protein